jgi:Aerotolerance regulator N-terminal
MIWNHPAALAGLALVAAPVIVHLLVRRHATRMVFPAMRFVPAVRAAAVRLRAPSDPGLLLLRIGIVAAAAVAAAQPLLKTAARQRAWDSRIARAVIVDTSASVPSADATRLADGALAGAFVSHRFAASDLRDGLRRASEWLATAAAARHEIAIVSDFQRGSIDEADVAGVARSTGVTLLRAGQPRAVMHGASVDGWRGARWDASLALESASTQVTWTRGDQMTRTGLTVRAGEGDRAAADRAAHAARSFGVPHAEPSRPVEVSFDGAPAEADTPPATPWIVSAAIALRGSELLAETGARIEVGERDGVMRVKAALPASSPVAPAVVRAALLAAAPRIFDPEAERAVVDESVLSRWRRDAAPVASTAQLSDESDGRWLWALALALLLVEGIVRRRGASIQEREVHADAA